MIASVVCSRPIRILEAAYQLAGSDEDWLMGVVRAARQDLDLGQGVVAYLARFEGSGMALASPIVSRGADAVFVERVRAGRTPPEVVDYIRGHVTIVGGVRQTFGGAVGQFFLAGLVHHPRRGRDADGNAHSPDLGRALADDLLGILLDPGFVEHQMGVAIHETGHDQPTPGVDPSGTADVMGGGNFDQAADGGDCVAADRHCRVRAGTDQIGRIPGTGQNLPCVLDECRYPCHVGALPSYFDFLRGAALPSGPKVAVGVHHSGTWTPSLSKRSAAALRAIS